MSDQINQIQASFDAIEDRILLKFKTLNEDVYLAWVSRRYCKLLIPVLQGKHPQSEESLIEPGKKLEKEFEREKAQQEGDFSRAYEEPATPHYPLGEEPILLAQISFKDLHTDHASMKLEPNQGAGLSLPYHPQLLGPMLGILTKAIEKADWNLGDEITYQLPTSDAAVH